MQVISKGIELVEEAKVTTFEKMKVFKVWKDLRKLGRELQQLLDQQ